jgi:hypothetical protein
MICPLLLLFPGYGASIRVHVLNDTVLYVLEPLHTVHVLVIRIGLFWFVTTLPLSEGMIERCFCFDTDIRYNMVQIRY